MRRVKCAAKRVISTSGVFLNPCQRSECAACARTHSAHQGVENTDSEGGAAGEGLSEVQLGVWVIIIILVQELNV